VKPNVIAGGYKHTCFKPPENDGGLAQLAGNKIQLEEVANTLVLNFRRTPEILIQSKKNHRLMFCDLKWLLKVRRLCAARVKILY